MTKPFIIILLLSLIGFGCNRNTKDNKSANEAEETTLVFKSLFPADSSFKNDLRQRISSAQKHFDAIKGKDADDLRKIQKLDSLKLELDTAKIHVIIHDTLLAVRPDYLKSKERNMVKNGSSLYAGLEKWMSEIEITTGSPLFSMKNLLTIPGYECRLQGKSKKPVESVLNEGTLRMSRVFFNRELTKAFVYTEVYCGNLCGASYDVFLEKKDGKWVIKKKIMGWVS